MSADRESPSRSLFGGGSLVALMAAALYLAGMAYHRGFLQAFHVDEALVPLSFERTVVVGFQSLVLATAGRGVPIGLLAAGLLAMYFLWHTLVEGGGCARIWQCLRRRSASNGHSSRKTMSIWWRPAPVFGDLLVFLLLVVFGSLPAAVGYRVGKTSGEAAREHCDRGDGVFSGMVTLVPSVVVLDERAAADERALLGYIVDRSQDTLVFYGAGTVRLFPIASIAEIRYYPVVGP